MAEAVTGKQPGSNPLADLGEPLVEAGGNRNSPWGHRYSHFGEVNPPGGPWHG